MKGIRVSVFRNTFREGFHEGIKDYYKGPFYDARDFFSPGAPFNFNATDVLILTTADRDLLHLFQQTDTLRHHPHLRVVAIVHRAKRFVLDEKTPVRYSSRRDWPLTGAALQGITSLVQRGSITFLTLSPHVQSALKTTLSATMAKLGHHQAPLVELFVPVSRRECDNPTRVLPSTCAERVT